MEPRFRWYDEFSDEERAELEAWLAEVNRVNDVIPGPTPDDSAAQPDAELPF